MSFVQSNLHFEPQCYHYTKEEAEALSVEAFDRLCLADQIYLFNNYPNEYCRLTGRPFEPTETNTPTPTKTKEELFAEEFERIVDDAFVRVLGHRAGEWDAKT